MLSVRPLLVFLTLASALAFAQVSIQENNQPPASAQVQEGTASAQNQPASTNQSQLVSREINALNYKRKGKTKVDFRGTDLMPHASGEAQIASKDGHRAIDLKLQGLESPTKLGREYLTYVLWAITPEGKATNLGQVLVHHHKSEVKTGTDLQAFAMIVTAEPDFAVAEPSDRAVLENVIRPDTKANEQPITAHYQLVPRSAYLEAAAPLEEEVYKNKGPNDLLQARNAFRIARNANAPQYASETYRKAQSLLQQAESAWKNHESKNVIDPLARQATQASEEARMIALSTEQRARLVEQQQEAHQRAIEAQQQAEQAASQAQAEAAQRQQAEAQAQQAQEQAQQAQQQARQQAEQQREQLQAANQQAQAAQQQAQAAQQRAQLAEQNQEQMRQRLLGQLNQVLQTKDTARGLVADMPDVLFDFNKATLKPGAKERLAKVSGIILAYPDLHLKIEGFTDSIGSDAYNQKLSEERAAAVRDFLIQQGVPVNDVIAQGFGKADPVASNSTPEGRQQNRRVDLVVSGEAIGSQIAPAQPSGTAVAPSASSGSSSTQPGSNGSATPPMGNNGTMTPAGTSSGAPISSPPPR